MFALFKYDTYYPTGGWNDFRGVFTTLEDAKTAAPLGYGQHWHIVNLSTLEAVAENEDDE
jgi:hypothetical protein